MEGFVGVEEVRWVGGRCEYRGKGFNLLFERLIWRKEVEGCL